MNQNNESMSSSSTITTFMGSASDHMINLRGNRDLTRSQGEAADASLSAFLARPIKIGEIVATTVTTPVFDVSFDPWLLFLTEASVKKRIEGYKNLQGTLHIRIVMNGNAWYMGLGAATYLPRNQADLTYATSDFNLTTARLSMFPSLYLYPSISEAGEMIVPFLNPDNWIDLLGTTYTTMGDLRIRSISNLRHIAGYDSTLQINIFAYMTDVVLASPTSGTFASYTAQSGEYSPNGVVSKPASQIAHYAGLLSEAPVIGVYAMATSMVASTIGAVARIFGYSRPNVVTDIMRCKVHGIGLLANTDNPEALQKLTLDSKQELTIDPRTVGLGETDELFIPYICGKECFVCTFTWDQTQSDGTPLRYMNVTPCMHLVNTSTTPDEIILTPMFTVASMFRYWKGSIKFTFRMSSSPLHRGVLRLSYDPYNVSPTTAYNLNYSKVVDISGVNEFSFEVGWSSSRGWLLVDDQCLANVLPNHNNPLVDPDYHNGSICISVVNPLTSPDSAYNAPVEISCFVSALPDIEFADPTDNILMNCEYYPQSGEINNMGVISTEVPGDLVPNHRVYFGESIVSIRTLLKRYCYHSAIQPGSNFQGWWKEFNVPYYNGQRTHNRHTTATGIPYNYAAMTHINWILPCYVGWRGGMRSKFVPINNSGIITVRRVFPDLSTTVGTTGISLATTNSSFSDEMMRIQRGALSGAGAAAMASDGSLEVEFPFASWKRFAHGRNLLNATASNFLTGDNEMHIGFCAQTQSNSRGLLRYVSVGEDFNTFMFIGQPVICYRTRLASATALTLPTV